MPTPRNIGRHVVIFILVLVALSAVAIWFDLGPAVHSSSALPI